MLWHFGAISYVFVRLKSYVLNGPRNNTLIFYDQPRVSRFIIKWWNILRSAAGTPLSLAASALGELKRRGTPVSANDFSDKILSSELARSSQAKRRNFKGGRPRKRFPDGPKPVANPPNEE